MVIRNRQPVKTQFLFDIIIIDHNYFSGLFEYIKKSSIDKVSFNTSNLQLY